MSKRLFVLVSLVIAASMLLAACGGAATAAPQRCPPLHQDRHRLHLPRLQHQLVRLQPLKIVSDLPMTGASLTQTQTIVNAEQLRLAEANNVACGGKYTLAYEIDDEPQPATGAWDGATETQNATKPQPIKL